MSIGKSALWAGGDGQQDSLCGCFATGEKSTQFYYINVLVFMELEANYPKCFIDPTL